MPRNVIEGDWGGGGGGHHNGQPVNHSGIYTVFRANSNSNSNNLIDTA